MELSKEQKLEVLDNRLAQWKQALYGHTIDMRVLKLASFKEMVELATAKARQAQAAIDGFEKERAALE